MKTLIKISWRNIWRNKTRSIILIMAMFVGLVGGIVAVGFSNGMVQQRINDFITTQTGHIQVHHTEHPQENNVKYTLKNDSAILNWLEKQPAVKGYSNRMVTNGMASSSQNSSGVEINGIIPEREKTLSTIHQSIDTGRFFDKKVRNPVVIGESLAEKLDISIGSRMVLQFQDMNQELTGGAFTVAGIFSTNNSRFDEGNVYTLHQDLGSLLGKTGINHEISILLNDHEQLDEIHQSLEAQFPNVLIRNWKTISPEMAYMNDYSNQALFMYMGIILLGLAFGILNTMLMAVLERHKEIGMLMAVGMKRQYIFSMIVLETIFLSIIGGLLGIIGGSGWIYYLKDAGINLSAFSEGMSSFGLAEIIYPILETGHYIQILILVIVTALAAAIYPAIKALKLNPAEAIHN